jgi:hypothetical protein
MKILTTRSQLRHTLETAHRVIFGSGAVIGHPVITALSPAAAPAGMSIIISGTGFTGVSAVTFGMAPASFTVIDDTTITAIVPSGTGAIGVEVTGVGGVSNSTTFNYVPGTGFLLGPDGNYLTDAAGNYILAP